MHYMTEVIKQMRVLKTDSELRNKRLSEMVQKLYEYRINKYILSFAHSLADSLIHSFIPFKYFVSFKIIERKRIESLGMGNWIALPHFFPFFSTLRNTLYSQEYCDDDILIILCFQRTFSFFLFWPNVHKCVYLCIYIAYVYFFALLSLHIVL